MRDQVNGRTHLYNADATAMNGTLQLPVVQDVRAQARITLPEEGGYLSQYTDSYWLESVLSYQSGYTQLAGNRDEKPGHGWATLTTTVIEGLNVMEVLTADRVVGQIITEHPLEGYVPSVSFLGTRFENLCIAGQPVELDMNLNILGAKPANDISYAFEPGVIERVERQYKNVLAHKGLPINLRERYQKYSSSLRGAETFECSLVNQVAGDIPGSSYGNIIDIPGIGKVTLCKVTVTSDDMKPNTQTAGKTTITLTMLDFDFGCVISGKLMAAAMVTNGQSNP